VSEPTEKKTHQGESSELLTIVIPDYEFDDGKESDVIFISKSAYLKSKEKRKRISRLNCEQSD
jgi:hypothetical protein